MNEKLQIVFGLLGGLAVFLYGMNMMSECLQKAAGEKMKKILEMLTKNPVMGAVAGALVTAVLQSSSATTVMAIGFVSAGLMTLPQSISIILGANIGTTMTAQLIAFKLSDYIYIIIFAGFIVSFVCKSEKVKNVGQTVFAFGLLFLGIETMGSVMKPLATSPVFTDLIGKVAHIPILGVAVGTLMTLVVQSSSATIAVLQNFASQAGPDGVTSIIGLTGAIPILFGDNIGTTITAVLASIGQSRDAKRTAVAHCVFNISGCLLFIWFIKPFAYVIQKFSPKGPEVEVISRQIANAHTAFNFIMTLIWIPLVAVMVKIVMKIVPDGKEKVIDETKPIYLDFNMLNQPAAALRLVAKEVLRCGEVVNEMMNNVVQAVQKESKEYIKKSRECGEIVANLYDEITEYLAELFSLGVLTEQQATQTAGLMYVLSDIDRLGYLSMEITDFIQGKIDKKYDYSSEAMKDLQKSLKLIETMYGDLWNTLFSGNMENAGKLIKKKEEVMDLDILMRKNHMKRVRKKTCKAKMTASFTKILHNINRMANSCVNIMDAAVNGMSFDYFLQNDDIEEN